MSQAYKAELYNLISTYQLGLEIEIEKLSNFCRSSSGLPLIAVGSGGSLTSAHVAALLHEHTGGFARAVTPLEITSSGSCLRNSVVLVLSAQGRNKDILSAFQFAAHAEPLQLMSFCANTNTPLGMLTRRYYYASCFEFDLTSGQDGFLATNSLLASVTVLVRAYQTLKDKLQSPLIGLPETITLLSQLEAFVKSQPIKDTWIFLHGKWGTPAAIDAESKFTEAAVGHVQVSDYRNFGHGRHHWLAKHNASSIVVALITPDDETLAEKTLRLLPKDIQVVRLSTAYNGPYGMIELLYKVLHLVSVLGSYRKIDPGRPGIPSYGRRLYHLGNLPKDPYAFRPRGMTRQEAVSIHRKCKEPSLDNLSDEQIRDWRVVYNRYIQKLESAVFGAIAFDYDGTLNDLRDRNSHLSTEMSEQLIQMLSNGALIGIATGRGKSVRFSLQRMIPRNFWRQIIIGYYNGSDIAFLDDDTRPDKTKQIDSSIMQIWESIKGISYFTSLAEYECRPTQITVQPTSIEHWLKTRSILIDIVKQMDSLRAIQILESSHSIDIIAPGVSKKLLVHTCSEFAVKHHSLGEVLCIGDKGAWPGNDYDFLATPYSLSVDSVSSAFESCWNISPAGHRGIQATLDYLECVNVVNGRIHLDFRTLRRKP